MLPQELIRRKRDNGQLSEIDIQTFVNGIMDNGFSSEQIAAMAMAIFIRSLNFQETAWLTRSMLLSGQVIDWNKENLNAPTVDKHSTGGEGDKVSLLLAPLVAAAGAYIPMIAGRGLGHSGGTLDKLDSIPGYNSTPDIEKFKSVVKSVGCAVIGQTPELAPADRRFYAIRDVTATVESVPLITASILSKKLSEGLKALIMDVKVGTGAFMQTIEAAEELSKSIIGTAAEIGLPTHVLITDMNEVLGKNAGNGVEIKEVIDYLTGEGREPRLHEVVMSLASEMLCIVNIANDDLEARKILNNVLNNGLAAEKFEKMIHSLGGPADFISCVNEYLPVADVIKPVCLSKEGYISRIDVRMVGNAIIELGGGRKDVEDKIDYSVGLTEIAGLGEKIENEQPIAYVHAKNEGDAERCIHQLKSAYKFSQEACITNPVIHSVIYDI